MTWSCPLTDVAARASMASRYPPLGLAPIVHSGSTSAAKRPGSRCLTAVTAENRRCPGIDTPAFMTSIGGTWLHHRTQCRRVDLAAEVTQPVPAVPGGVLSGRLDLVENYAVRWHLRAYRGAAPGDPVRPQVG